MSEDYDFYDDLEDDPYIDCGLNPDGQCMKAGTEECDWECPNSHGEFYAGSELWNKKHDAGVPVDGCDCTECRAAQFRTKTIQISTQPDTSNLIAFPSGQGVKQC